ncbi:hypothetical protein EJ08DRAFT_666285 [Tothia fuscella]|uniref:Uncharacterized protein n=1 Tax=Tothia fuscella TaxID=1048955 RepID=A0A9P4TRU6_9PEZI|nr:hypothetical protein EJ08DRAFT_666285 [Tothia fuscella]
MPFGWLSRCETLLFPCEAYSKPINYCDCPNGPPRTSRVPFVDVHKPAFRGSPGAGKNHQTIAMAQAIVMGLMGMRIGIGGIGLGMGLGMGLGAGVVLLLWVAREGNKEEKEEEEEEGRSFRGVAESEGDNKAEAEKEEQEKKTGVARLRDRAD